MKSFFILSTCLIFTCASPSYRNEFSLPDIRSRFDRQIQNILVHNEDTRHKNAAGKAPPRPKEVENWPVKDLNVGQISGVSVNTKNQPVIFHRANHVWDYDSFDYSNNYLQRHKGPIAEDTILVLNPDTGDVLSSWGSNFFYMPHGITIDCHDNVWVTDVALHQVFKFKPGGDTTPLLEFGTPFRPGSSFRHLCKPTSVAIATTGEIFIADGYCNNRVLKFNAAGGLLRIIPNPPEMLSMVVPHGLALMEKRDRICIADRENMRVVCPRAGLYITSEKNSEEQIPLIINEPEMGRIFDIVGIGHFLYAVNGNTNRDVPAGGVILDPFSETMVDRWGPTNGKFNNPHAMAINPNRTALYVSEINPNRIWKFDI